VNHPAAERITPLEWLAFAAIMLIAAGVALAAVGCVIFAIRALKS
jgi:hypothetical protein